MTRLVLFFTQGVSLQTWDEVGMFAREVALYQRLQWREVEPSFVTYGNGNDLQFANRLPGIEIICNRLNLPLEWYQRQLRWSPPQGDVFKSNQVAGADVALAAARRAKAKLIARCGYLLSEFQEQKYGDKSAEAKMARRLEKEVFSEADRVVLTTGAMASSVQGRYALPAEKISVVPNYVETERFRPVGRASGERIRIGFVGRLDAQKNLFTLFDGVAGLNVELLLVGYGPLKESLEAHAVDKKIDVKFLGKLPNTGLPEFLNSCDLFVLPSLYEGHPKALIEAMACGLPVIGTRVPGIRELIQDGENGLLCDPSAEGIREAVERLVEDIDLRALLGKNARLFAEQNFSLDRIVELELSILNELSQ